LEIFFLIFRQTQAAKPGQMPNFFFSDAIRIMIENLPPRGKRPIDF